MEQEKAECIGTIEQEKSPVDMVQRNTRVTKKIVLNNQNDSRLNCDNARTKRKIIGGSRKYIDSRIKKYKSTANTDITDKADQHRQADTSKKQVDSNLNADLSINQSPDGSEKEALHSETVGKAVRKRRKSTRLAKQNVDESSNDAPSNGPIHLDTMNEKIARLTTIVKTRVNGIERAKLRCGYCKKWKTNAVLKCNMLEHLSKHENGILRCGKCGHDAVNVAALSEHVARVHSRQPQFVCAQCGKKCFSSKQLRQHEDTHNLQPRSCRRCGQTLQSLARLKAHMTKEHGGDGIYSCDECRKTFVFKKWYDAHMAKQACSLNATCLLCGAVVRKGAGLSLHMKHMHTGEKHESCSFCPYKAFTKTQVQLHERTHTRDHPFSCDLCSFSAAKKFQVTSHMRTHTREKPFHCELCPYASSWKLQLHTHHLSHASATATTCPVCSVVCRDANFLRRHQYRDHERPAFDQKRTETGTETTPDVPDFRSQTQCASVSEFCLQEQAAASSEEVTSYIIMDEAVAKDIERLGLLQAISVAADDDTINSVAGNMHILTSNDTSGSLLLSHDSADTAGDPPQSEQSNTNHPLDDIVIRGSETNTSLSSDTECDITSSRTVEGVSLGIEHSIEITTKIVGAKVELASNLQ